MKKIGILGGTFNPIHHGHLILGQAAKEEFGLDEIWLCQQRIRHIKRSVAVSVRKQSRYDQAGDQGFSVFQV